MKLIQYGGYNDSERHSYEEIIFSNTIQSIRYVSPLPPPLTQPSAVLEALRQLDVTLAPQNDTRPAAIMALPLQIETNVLSQEALGRDPGVKEAVARSPEFQLSGSAVYYFNSIERMTATNYIPTDQDILRSRGKTTGITETTFEGGGLRYKLFDVRGQRSERKNWIRCFENVTVLVFLVGLSEYGCMRMRV